MSRTKKLTFLTAGYNQAAIIFPFLVVSPVYFFGTLTLGGLMQISQAFSQVQSALSFFVTAYSSIADWKAVLDRLAGFEASIDWAQKLGETAPRVEFISEGAGTLHVEQLAVGLPNGQEIVRLSDFVIAPGERILVTGPSGSGKTSLFRALGGIWPFGTGSVRIPEGASVLVLPQRPYLPLGTLRGALAYPGPQDAFSAEEIDEVLDAVGLRRSATSSTRPPTGRTSCPAARSSGSRSPAHFCKSRNGCSWTRPPARSTRARRRRCIRLLIERLPDTAIVSIGHRSSLVQFHGRFFRLAPVREGLHRLSESEEAPAPAAADEEEEAEREAALPPA